MSVLSTISINKKDLEDFINDLYGGYAGDLDEEELISKLLDEFYLVPKSSAEEHAITIWSVDDVLQQAKDSLIFITRSEAKDIIQYLDKNQDTEWGISWYTIDDCLSELIPKNTLDENKEEK